MANRILRRHADALGYKNDFTILDQRRFAHAGEAKRRCAGLSGKRFPKPDVLLGVLQHGRQHGKNHRAFRHPAVCPNRPNINIDDVVRVNKLYETKKREQNAMDFDDLLVNGLRLFREHATMPNTTGSASYIYWWTSTRTPTPSRPNGWTPWRPRTATCSLWATISKASTHGAARIFATSCPFPSGTPTPRCSSWRPITAACPRF